MFAGVPTELRANCSSNQPTTFWSFTRSNALSDFPTNSSSLQVGPGNSAVTGTLESPRAPAVLGGSRTNFSSTTEGFGDSAASAESGSSGSMEAFDDLPSSRRNRLRSFMPRNHADIANAIG